jgi:hypothetical protein
MGAEQQQQWPKAPAKRLATLRQEASKRPKVVDGTHMGSFSSAAEVRMLSRCTWVASPAVASQQRNDAWLANPLLSG